MTKSLKTGLIPILALLLFAPLAHGAGLKIEGVIVQLDSGAFVIRNHRGQETGIVLSGETEVEERKRNFLRDPIRYTPRDLVLGLHVLVKGEKNGSGNLVAEEVKFTQRDLAVARMFSSGLTRVRSSIRTLGTRVSGTENHMTRLDGRTEHQEGAIGELEAALRLAQRAARGALDRAHQAHVRLDGAEDRIARLDDYRLRQQSVVRFGFDSTELSEESRQVLDRLGADVKGKRGFLIEIAGFTSAEGDPSYNQQLSQRRALVVARYLVREHGIHPRRVLSPWGYGRMHPVAGNESRQGRRLNRRVEVRVLVNRGLEESD